MSWVLHYGGRGQASDIGHLGCRHRVVGPQARESESAALRCTRRLRPACRAMREASTCILPQAELLSQTERNIDKGLRAIKMKVGRSRLSEERAARCRDARSPRRRLSADGRPQHALDVDQAIAAARALRDSNVVWSEEPTIPTTCTDTRGSCASPAYNHRRISRWSHDSPNLITEAIDDVPEPNITDCEQRDRVHEDGELCRSSTCPVTSHGAHNVTVHLLSTVSNRCLPGSARVRPRPLPRTSARDRRRRCESRPSVPGHGME